MDFMKWLNSLDELLYEVMSWLIFFPLTLWRTLVRPISTMTDADAQLALPAEAQYSGGLSPPLFLAIALLLSSALATAMGEKDTLVANQHGLAALIKDDATALALRVLLFAVLPLAMAVLSVRARRLPLDRQTLRAPFYTQCHPAAAFALVLSLGASLCTLPRAVPATQETGAGLILTAFLYYLVTETRWFAAQLGTGYLRAFATALLGLFIGASAFLAVGMLLAL